LIRAFVNNQSSTNSLLKQKRKVIEAKVAISLPQATAPKQCKQENQVESFINQVKVVMKVWSPISHAIYYSVTVTSSYEILLYW
ncbi:hypothetical protein M513_13637, partial [Trichuris suis]